MALIGQTAAGIPYADAIGPASATSSTDDDERERTP